MDPRARPALHLDADHADHDDFGGLQRDAPHLLGRRRVLALGGLGIAGLLASCGSSDDGASSAAATAAPEATAAATTAASGGIATPQETAGPFPADGSNGPNVLTDGAIVRQDLTTSVGDASETAEGVATRFELTVVDNATGDPRPGVAVYAWHCDAAGRYSIYEVAEANYLRGVQIAGDDGTAAFASIYPGCYAGRWPHVHFEVYDSAEEADAGSAAVLTSQLALPKTTCEAVYADDRYGDSAQHLGALSLATDNVFSDGWTQQLATVSGSTGDGYTAALLVRV